MITKIIDNLYIGDIQDSLEDFTKFDVILSICPKDSLPQFPSNKHTHFILSAYDDSFTFNQFELANSLIDKCLRNHNTILVHCVVGQSRSVAIVASYLHKFEDLSLADALNLIEKKRVINIEPGLRSSLIRYCEGGL